MIEYSRCDLAIFRAECGDIMEAHYAEIGQPLKLSIDWNLYAELDRLEKLVIIVARDLCNVVGYNIFIINRHPHYDAISATNDGYQRYLLPRQTDQRVGQTTGNQRLQSR